MLDAQLSTVLSCLGKTLEFDEEFNVQVGRVLRRGGGEIEGRGGRGVEA